MKYRCDMVKDLMPLCLDHEATEASEQTVIEHLAECKECAGYYEALGKELELTGEQSKQDNKYVVLARKIRKRRTIVSIVMGLLVGMWFFVCLNFASGYRISSRAAADLSGRLNNKSQEIACFEWKDDFHIYIYDSDSCYDVVGVEKTWKGWKKHDNFLSWPKWSWCEENAGMEVAGAITYFQDNEGVQIFPIISYDEKVKNVEVTCYGKTQEKEVKPGELILFTFDAIYEQLNEIEAIAYDEIGNAIYRLDNWEHRWIWVPITE